MRLGVLHGIIDNSDASLRRKTSMMTSSNTAPSSKAVSETIVSMGINEEDDPTNAEVFKFVDELAPETLSLLEAELGRIHGDRVQHLVTTLVYGDRTSHHVREAKLREYLILIDDEEREDLNMNLALIEGLHCMELLEQHDDMSAGSVEHLAQAKGLIKVARAAVAIEDERGRRVHDQEGIVFLTEPHVIRIVMQNPERADQIADFITERQEIQHEAIAEMLTATPPLAPGTL